MSRSRITVSRSITDITGKPLQYTVTETDVEDEEVESFLTYGLAAYVDLSSHIRLKVYEFSDFSVRREDCVAFIEKLKENAVPVTELHLTVLRELGSI